MPDANSPRPPVPSDWGSAFAALGSEMPPVGSWDMLSRALAAHDAVVAANAPTGGADHHASVGAARANAGSAKRTRRPRAPLWLASAAGIGAATLVAMLVLRPQPELTEQSGRPEVAMPRSTDTEAKAPVTATTDTGEKTRATATAGVATSATSAPSDSADHPQVAAATPSPVTQTASRPSAMSAIARTQNRPARASGAPQATVASRAATPGIGDAAAARPIAPASSHDPVVTAGPSNDTATARAPLLAESARLEALIALANDDSVASGSGLVLTGELRDRIGQIDAALTQLDLDEASRTALWQQRVDALRDLAGLQSTQRWLAANGERYDGALVSVH